jgi:hypothetical protein
VLGRLERAVGEPAAARRYWEAARDLFENIGAPVPADLTDVRQT